MAGSAEQVPRSDIDRKPVILVVEDEIVIRSLVATYLRDSDFTVIEAENALEAVAVLTSQTDVDIVFTDVNMPGKMDGLALAAWINQHYIDIPVLITSGAAHMLDLSGKVPASCYIPKPYIFGHVETLIREFLDMSEPPES